MSVKEFPYSKKRYYIDSNEVAGGGGSSDLNNPIELELIDSETNTLVTQLTTSEIYALCQTGTPYFIITAEQAATYETTFLTNAKYFINSYYIEGDGDEILYAFEFVLLGIVDATEAATITHYVNQDAADAQLTIASQL